MCESSNECTFLNEFNKTIGIGICQDSECFCSVFVGFTGDTCSDVSPQVIANRVVNLLGVMLFSTQLAILLRVLSNVFFLKIEALLNHRKSEGLQRTRRLLFVILGFLFLSLTGNLIQILLTTRSVFDPTSLELDIRGNEEFVNVSPPELFAVIQVLNLSFFLFSVIAICISWIDLLARLADFTNDHKRIKTIRNIEKTLKYTLIVGAFLLPLLTIIGLREINQALASTLLLILIMMILVGRYYLVRILKQFHNELTIRTIKSISKFALQLGMLLIAASISGILFGTLDIRGRLSNNIVQVDVLVLILVSTFILILNANFAVILSYVYSVYKNLTIQGTTKRTGTSNAMETSE